MKSQSLLYLVEAARHGKISRAAVALGVSQPRLSQMIGELESRFGEPLFTRTGRGIVPTDAGRRAVDLAKGILGDLDLLEEEMAAQSAVIADTVVIGAPPSVCPVLVPALVAEFRQSLPRVTLRIFEGYSGAVQRALVDGEADIGILYSGQSHGRMPVDTILNEKLLLVGPPGAPSFDGAEIPFADAMALPLVLPSRMHGLRQLVDREARRQGISVPAVLEIDSLSAAKDLCATGGLYTILPGCAVAREVAQGVLATRPIADPDLCRTLALATTTARPLTAAARTAARLCIATARRLVHDGLWLGEV